MKKMPGFHWFVLPLAMLCLFFCHSCYIVLSQPMGRIVYESVIGADTQICVVFETGGKIYQLTDAVNNTSPVWSPDGTKIAFVSDRDGDNEIFVMNGDGSNERQLTANGVIDQSPVWSPDGERIYFYQSGIGGYDLYAMGSDGTGLDFTGIKATDPSARVSISPDGTTVLYSYSPMGSPTLYSRRLGATDSVSLGSAEAGSWSPDGKRIACLYNDGVYSVRVMNSDGTAPVIIDQGASGYATPVWSPDGRKVVYRRDPGGGNGELVVAASDNSFHRILMDNTSDNMLPSWSPDGNTILFASNLLEGDTEIVTIGIDSNNLHALTENGQIDTVPVWAPR